MAREPQSVDPDKLKDAFKRAAEIAEVVPATMQEAAFHRALDQILGSEGSQPPAKHRGMRQSESGSGDAGDGDPAARLIEGVNRTAYPEVSQASKVLDRALGVLRLAGRDFEIDGLTAPEVAKVLTEKFRQRTSRQAVAQALGAAHTMVDTAKRGRVTAYRIMQAGEDYLDAGGSQGEDGESSRVKPTRRRSRKAGRTQRAGGEAKSSTAHRRASRPSRRRGPKTVLAELIDSDFFKEPRTINDAQEQLRHKKGVRFSLQELSPALVRLLRDGRLDRDRNASGQYEYRAK